MTEALLELDDVTASYHDAPVIHNVGIAVRPGEIVALLGPNGAGKTTTLRVISGLLPAVNGTVRLLGEDIAGSRPELLARRGLGHVPEGRGIFFGLTVAEHFRLGYRGERLDVERAFAYFPELSPLRNRRAGRLSGGEQQMLGIARVLARRPRVLLLDEPSLGLAPIIIERLLATIRDYVQETDTACLLVEQHVHLALQAADRGYVLAQGTITTEGAPQDLTRDRELLVTGYLGVAPSTTRT